MASIQKSTSPHSQISAFTRFSENFGSHESHWPLTLQLRSMRPSEIFNRCTEVSISNSYIASSLSYHIHKPGCQCQCLAFGFSPLLWGSNWNIRQCTLSYGVECWLWEFVSPVNKSPELCVLFRVYKTLVTASFACLLIFFCLFIKKKPVYCFNKTLWPFHFLTVSECPSAHCWVCELHIEISAAVCFPPNIWTFWVPAAFLFYPWPPNLYNNSVYFLRRGLSHVRLCACYMIFTWHFL